MTIFPTSLMQKTTQQPLSLTDQEVALLLANLGNCHADIRDQTVFTLLARGFEEQALTANQQKQVLHFLLHSRSLFAHIDSPQTNAIFLRSFTALVTGLVLTSDVDHPWLPATCRLQLFNDALTYLARERDARGWVAGCGWAHGIAHGADLLGTAWSHPRFPVTQTPLALRALSQVFQRQQAVFTADEEPRLAFSIIRALHAQKLTATTLITWLTETDARLWQNFSDADLTAIARRHNWLVFLQHLYFFLPANHPAQLTITAIFHDYYQRNGYLG